MPRPPCSVRPRVPERHRDVSQAASPLPVAVVSAPTSHPGTRWMVKCSPPQRSSNAGAWGSSVVFGSMATPQRVLCDQARGQLRLVRATL
jgi:hypothetical protein